MPSAWARDILANPDVVILDTETTGLPRPKAYITEIAIISKRAILFDTLLDPRYPLDPKAIEASGIRPEDLVGKRTFAEVAKELAEILNGKTVVGWNIDFDRTVIGCELTRLRKETGRIPRPRRTPRWVDACEPYRQFLRERGLYEYGAAKLNGPHRAKGDCLAVVEKLREIAAG